jgi:7-cyano-7-deazaguanine reductase
LCPVTAQPDWASIVIETEAVGIVPETLLAYLLGYRNHQEFHEQCVERIFCDIQKMVEPAQLSVQALYTRRGGLDISPWRSTLSVAAPLRRTSRQ